MKYEENVGCIEQKIRYYNLISKNFSKQIEEADKTLQYLQH